MLEPLGLLVDLVPAVAEGLGQVHLEQAVVADHLQRHRLTGRRQGRAPVAVVADQAKLGQAVQHLRRRGRRHPKPFGELVGTHRPMGARAELVKGLQVVLLGLGEHVSLPDGHHWPP